MGFGKTELCMLAVIAASALYLHLGEDQQKLPVFPSEGDIAEDLPDYDPAAEQSVRTCQPNGHAPNVFVLDLTFSVFPDETITNVGDTILENLFRYCSCTNWGGDCYEWTLVIDELDYVKTQKGSCAKKKEYYPVYKNLTNSARNSTVATVYVREGGSFDVQPLNCVYDTVNIALEDILLKTEKEYIEVVTVLANEIERITSTCCSL